MTPLDFPETVPEASSLLDSVEPRGNSSALIWLWGIGLGGLGVLSAAAWVYEKTRKKIEHPNLGVLVYGSGSWSGLLPHFKTGQPAVRFELPGDKEGPNAQEIDRFQDFWKNMESTVSSLRDSAIAEFEEISEAYEDSEEAELVENIQKKLSLDAASFDEYWILIEVYREVSELAPSVGWVLEFEVAWDVEHSRAAYLSVDGQLLAYNLTCAGSGLEEG